MKQFSKREYIIFFACLVLVIGFFAYKFIITPMAEQGGDFDDSISLVQRKLDKNNQLIRSSQTIDVQYKKLVEFLGVSVSEGSEFSQIVSKLEGLAREANIHVANVQPQRAISKESIRIFPVEIDIDGSWADIAKFLYLVQAEPNFFNIDELNLEKYSDTAASLRGRLVLSRVRVVTN